ncbi:unnamed protein product [Vitrella brassicaformis CCMP3155]|uniref:Uncharacterized protein n=1 Tax=Vitrella brassicaformis (strain CCMP3155) TaxID=1169540 RepID=A0A0G4FFA9_VITBC|nr:unnamed protein product [Vitrella brassicaformis CCMP3155]|eukprot:CEM11846.1 unnamed protein product [Vitrella brassicaformis CCMP3155]
MGVPLPFTLLLYLGLPHYNLPLIHSSIVAVTRPSRPHLPDQDPFSPINQTKTPSLDLPSLDRTAGVYCRATKSLLSRQSARRA